MTSLGLVLALVLGAGSEKADLCARYQMGYDRGWCWGKKESCKAPSIPACPTDLGPDWISWYSQGWRDASRDKAVQKAALVKR